MEVPLGFRLELPVVEAAIAPELILELVRIGIHGYERQPGEQPNRAGDLGLHDIAHIAVDRGSKLGQIGDGWNTPGTAWYPGIGPHGTAC